MRIRWDAAAAATTGLELSTVAQWHRQISLEPTISTALETLEKASPRHQQIRLIVLEQQQPDLGWHTGIRERVAQFEVGTNRT